MKHTHLVLAAALGACAAPESRFSFRLGPTPVVSGARVKGAVNDRGYVALDDGAWELAIDMGSLAEGSHAISAAAGELSLLRKDTGDVFTTRAGGSCTVRLDPHESTNGDVVHAIFYCTALASTSGARADVTGGELTTVLDDPANDPKLTPPPR